jgi:lysophospholipid acyltransferase (LPLAT)-like uncharacterized protein
MTRAALALIRLAGMVLGCALRLWLATLRVAVRVHPASARAGRRVLALWHEATVPGLAAALDRRPIALVSRSRDGELGAAALARLGVPSVRGSSSRGGACASRALLRALLAGADVVVTVDGPKGPRRCAKPGASFLARRGDARLVPVGAAVSSGWRLRSWDGAVLPRPFSRVVVVAGPPVGGAASLDSALEAAHAEAALLVEALALRAVTT